MSDPSAEISAARDRGDEPAAYEAARRGLETSPDDPALLASMGRSLAAMGAAASAVPLLKRAYELLDHDSPESLGVGMQLARIEHQEGDLDVSLILVDELLQRAQGEQARQLRARRIETLIRLGRLDEARAAVGGALRTGMKSHRVQSLLAEIEAESNDRERTRARLEPLVLNEGIEARTRSYLAFLLSKTCDRLGDHDSAFEHADLGNRLLAAKFDVDAFEAETDAIIRGFPRDFDLPHASRSRGGRSVFVVGMPRSGTSLLEQIIDAHPDGGGIGERNEPAMMLRLLEHRTGRPHPDCLTEAAPRDLEEVADIYERMESRLQPRARRVSNKVLGLDRLLGFVSLALPASRAVVLRRRPLDNLLSIFLNPLGPVWTPWACSLDGLVAARRRFDRLCEHWLQVLEIPMLEMEYETLASNPESSIESLLDFLELPLAQSAIDFHQSGRTVMTPSRDQVSRPMNRDSIERWRRYESHIGPLLEAFPPSSD